MKVLNVRDIEAAEVYREFLRVPALEALGYKHGVELRVPQQPHTEDEVYFVVSGSGAIEIEGEDHAVTNGSVVYVPAGVKHHFHGVSETLHVLVVFALGGGYDGTENRLIVATQSARVARQLVSLEPGRSSPISRH